MRKVSLWARIEQFVRAMTFLVYTFYLSLWMITDLYVRPIYPLINRLCSNYFAKTFKYKEPIEYVGKQWAYNSLKILGIEVVVENNGCEMPETNKDTAILMFSHSSNLDPILLQAYYPFYLHFVAKESLFKIPILGRVLKSVGQIPIKRDNLAEAIHSLEESGRMIKQESRSICIAPEGTRRRKPSTGADQDYNFKKGPFHLSKTACVDVIPVVIIGANRLYPPGTPYPNAGTVVVRFGRKIAAKEVSESTIPELQEKVKRGFRDNLSEIDDKIIYSTEKKPYATFLLVLAILIGMHWSFSRFLCSLF